MLLNPQTADGGKADVFSLVKTLWVLASGQKYPLQGELRADNEQARLSSYVVDVDASLLDTVVEAGTRLDPELRLSMQAFAEELSEWLEPPMDASGTESIKGLERRVRALRQPYVAKEEANQRSIDKARECLSEITALVGSISKELAALGISGKRKRRGFMTAEMRRKGFYQGRGIYVFSESVYIETQPRKPFTTSVVYGMGMLLFEDEQVYVEAGCFHAGREVWLGSDMGILGGARLNRAIAKLQEELRRQVALVVERMISDAEARSAGEQ
jgi:hypothetical protein